MQNEVFIEIELDVDRQQSIDLAKLLDAGFLSQMTGYFEVLYEEGVQTDRSVFKLYFPVGSHSSRWDVEALLLSVGFEDYNLTEASVDRNSYLEAYKEHYEPLRLSEHFAVIPSWQKDSPKEAAFIGQFTQGVIPLYLDPGLAFGTGRHATTQMMIEYIDEQSWHGKTVLDAGCGSGILSLAVLKKDAAFVTGFDVDGNAVNASVDNLKSNQIETTRFEILQCSFDGLDQRRFDVVLANLTLNVFLQYKDVIRNLNADRLVVSGLLNEAREPFYRVFSDVWQVQSEKGSDGWLLLDLAKVQ